MHDGIQLITLTASDNVLAGKFSTNGHVLVQCDASLNPFTITLPNPEKTKDTIFIFKKIDSSSNITTITTADGVSIDGF